MDLLTSILAKGIAVPYYQSGGTYVLAQPKSGARSFAADLPGGARATAEFTQEPDYGVIRRRDTITNSGDTPIEVDVPSPAFTILGSTICVHAQKSKWAEESQNIRLDLEEGSASIGSKGRSCLTYAPYIRVESADFGTIDFHILPCGDWRANLQRTETGLRVTLDRFGAPERVKLAPGESMDLSLDCLICVCPARCLMCQNHDMEPAAAVAPKLDRRGPECASQIYATEKMLKRKRDVLPVVYNTWFDHWYKISIEGMETQLDTAAQVGCETLVVDAGWYGTHEGWWESAGDWTPNQRVFSKVSLEAFADRVRARGLDFGIWMEPERVHESAPVRKQHPEWFVQSEKADLFYPDLTLPQAREWVKSEISRVIDSYGVKWLKVDCNFNFSDDPHHTGHRLRHLALYDLLDEIAAKYPDLVLEGCASGGLRNDLLTASHFHTFFLSDTVDPIDVLRIGTSSFARVPPRMQSRWAVIYPINKSFTPYGREPFDTDNQVLCVQGATGGMVSSRHLDFAMRVNMPGVMAVGGNIAGLSDELKSELADHVSFYKKHRQFIQSAAAVSLTPVEPLDKRDGFSAIQLFDSRFSRSMVFVYNVRSTDKGMTVRPLGLDRESTYTVKAADGSTLMGAATGAALSEPGIDVACSSGHAEVILIDRQ